MIVIEKVSFVLEFLSSELGQYLKDVVLGACRFGAFFLFKNHLIDPKMTIEGIDCSFFGTSSSQLFPFVDPSEFIYHFGVHFHLIDFSFDDGI